MKIALPAADAGPRCRFRTGRACDLPGRPGPHLPELRGRPFRRACRSGAASSTGPPAPSCSTRPRAPALSTSPSTRAPSTSATRSSTSTRSARTCSTWRNIPTATYKGTLAGFKNGAPTEVDGEFTLHGVTKPLTLTIDQLHVQADPHGPRKSICGADATAPFNRDDFGIGFGEQVRLQDGREAGDPGGGDSFELTGRSLNGWGLAGSWRAPPSRCGRPVCGAAGCSPTARAKPLLSTFPGILALPGLVACPRRPIV